MWLTPAAAVKLNVMQARLNLLLSKLPITRGCRWDDFQFGIRCTLSGSLKKRY
ncbi:MAG: hypothetical protein ACLVEJ_19795 [Parabacteroides sp.]